MSDQRKSGLDAVLGAAAGHCAAVLLRPVRDLGIPDLTIGEVGQISARARTALGLLDGSLSVDDVRVTVIESKPREAASK